jgi:hypothetical protein
VACSAGASCWKKEFFASTGNASANGKKEVYNKKKNSAYIHYLSSKVPGNSKMFDVYHSRIWNSICY